MEYFFEYVYPAQPILHRQRAQEAAVNMDRSIEAYSMVVALCSYVMIQSNYKAQPNCLERQDMAQMSNIQFGHILLEESVRVRRGYDYRENPTPYTVLTSYLYYGCYFGLAKENTAWTHLREATTQAQLLGMHEEETYKHDPLDTSRKRVLYWLLFIAERYACFQAVLTKANETSEPTQSTNIARSPFTPSSTRPPWTKYLQTGQSPSVWS